MDTDLVVRAQHGDRDAFARLADASLDRLLAVARGILGDTGLAEDATQQALLDVWRNLPSLRDPARFEGWSYRLVVNACHSEARRSRRWISGAIAPLIHEPVEARDEIGTVDDRDELERAFRELSVDHRAVLVLHHCLGLTLHEIAHSLDIPEGTVRSRLYHAMKKMRTVLRIPTAGPDLAPGTERVRP
jgi:RNA polymerase sigma-70 factor (ECF subfamily)